MYQAIVKSLKQFLAPHFISTAGCNIFEEVILELAGVKSKPSSCKFGELDKETMRFSIAGITQSDTEKLLNYFKRNGDKDVCLLDDKTEFSCFVVKTSVVQNQLLPAFKAKLNEWLRTSPEKLDVYQKICESDVEIILLRLLDTIEQLELDRYKGFSGIIYKFTQQYIYNFLGSESLFEECVADVKALVAHEHKASDIYPEIKKINKKLRSIEKSADDLDDVHLRCLEISLQKFCNDYKANKPHRVFLKSHLYHELMMMFQGELSSNKYQAKVGDAKQAVMEEHPPKEHELTEYLESDMKIEKRHTLRPRP